MFDEESSERREKRLINSVRKEFIGISVPVKDEIHRVCSKEVSEFRQCERENEQNWKIEGRLLWS